MHDTCMTHQGGPVQSTQQGLCLGAFKGQQCLHTYMLYCGDWTSCESRIRRSGNINTVHIEHLRGCCSPGLTALRSRDFWENNFQTAWHCLPANYCYVFGLLGLLLRRGLALCRI